MPVKHMFSCTKVRKNKLHPFGKISADVFSLLYFKMCRHSQFLNFLTEEVLLGWRGCKLFWIPGSWVQEVSWSASHGQFHGRLATQRHLCFYWARVICARVVWSRFLESVSTSAKRHFLNNREFGHGVCSPVGILFARCIRQNACMS